MKNASKMVVLLLTFLLGFTVGRNVRKKPAEAAKTSDTVRTVVVDTVRYREPVAQDSMVVRYETVRVPYHIADASKMVDTITDTVLAQVPITQKRYGDSTYRAWVSGYRPRLDSIEVYPRRETVTVTNTVTRYKPRRWGVGVQMGYGVTSRGNFYPYIGVGVSWNILPL